MTLTTHDRAVWLENRRRGLGASDAAAIVGLSPWTSPYALYLEKTGEVIPEDAPSEQMEWGLRLEGVVAEAWAEKNGKPLNRYSPYDPRAVRVHPDHDWMTASLDAVTVDEQGNNAVLELKTASGWATHDWDDGVPPHVLIQVQWQLEVTGWDVGYVACLVGGSKFVQDEIVRDQPFIDDLVEAGVRFWDRVQRRDPPAVDGHVSTTEALKAKFRQSLDEAVECGQAGLAMVTERHASRADLKLAQERADLVDNRIRDAMGEAEVMTVFGEVAATWKPTKTGVRRLSVKEII